MSLDERDELTKKIAKLKAKAVEQGRYLKKLGEALERSPETVAFTGASPEEDSEPGIHWVEIASFPDLQDIVSLGNELRESIEQLNASEAKT
jgi:hypothetical protein